MKIMTAGKGFVSEHLPYPIIDKRFELDVKQIERVIDENKPDVIVNCIGKTGRPNIDWCQSHKEETSAINTALPILLAETCQKKNIRIVQLASGCIFYGQSPNTQWVVPQVTPNMAPVEVDHGWKETDFANPKSYYSKTKYACDLALGDMKNVVVLRIRMPISDKNHPRNLINKLRGYSQIINLPNSMTFMSDLTRCIDWAAKNDMSGIFHVVNPQPLTAAQIMTEYQKYDENHKFSIITEEQLDKLTSAKRSNCLLNGDNLRNAGFFMSNSKKALEECMKKYSRNINAI